MFVSKSFAYTSSQDSFWKSVNILIRKPHVVNKRLWGSKVLIKTICKTVLSNNDKLNSLQLKLNGTNYIDNLEQSLSNLLHQMLLKQCEETEENALEIILTELLPKNYEHTHGFQLIFIQKKATAISFHDVTPEDLKQKLCPDFSYTLSLKNKELILMANCETNSKSYQWLIQVLVPQFIKWSSENLNIQHNCNQSLALISNDDYYKLYNELKFKYGKELVKIWPECTDPSKFVYEDVAIATYLLLIWKDERKQLNIENLQSFVDLGCGNGLLVYILTMEGHIGLGIDVRKRQIWDMYPENVKLEEKTIVPSDTNLFPDVDCIIGNHSDELTPWIPVIASRSSYKCNFFLLPCCAYNFDGTKYQRKNSSKSQYTEYLEYIQELCEECGYNVQTDRLKIPSTKRICIVSRGRNYHVNEHVKRCEQIHNLINSRPKKDDTNTMWVDEFKPRESTERVRNCTKLDKNLINSLVDTISKHLLEGCNFESDWCPGKSVEINEIVEIIPQDKLTQLKSECGGLQTLLKNNHQIFKVQSGIVKLRYPKTIDEIKCDINKYRNKKNKLILKQKECWFYKNHPQGCPLSDNNCSYLH